MKAPAPHTEKSGLLSFLSYPFKVILLLAIGTGFYINAVPNELALDDGMVIENNSYVLKGLAGIKDILTHDAYQPVYDMLHSNQQLSGGRFRPLSIVTFAIEQQWIGTFQNGQPSPADWDTNKNGQGDPEEDLNRDGVFNHRDFHVRGAAFRHGVNVFLYVFSVLILFHMLHKYVLKDRPDIAFITALIFLVHPIHTEAVANIKSRDEVMSFFFMMLTLLGFVRFTEKGSWWTLGLSLPIYALALLSKEYSITLMLLLPVMLYVFYDKKWQALVIRTLPYALVAGVYIFFRIKAVGLGSNLPQTEIMNDPYLLATVWQKKATILFTPLLYLKQLVFPHPLLADYSYNHIPYRDFFDVEVWLSIGVHLALLVSAIGLTLKKHPLGFAISFYLANLALVCNLFVNIGGTLGERLIFHSSLGFAMVAAWVIVQGITSWKAAQKTKKIVLSALLILVTSVSAYKVIPRNAEWKNDRSLFLKDVQTAPRSVIASNNAGAQLLEMADFPKYSAQREALLQKAIEHLNRVIRIHPTYVPSVLNLGLAYIKLHQPDQAMAALDRAKALYPRHPFLEKAYPMVVDQYVYLGYKNGSEGNLDQALENFRKAVEISPDNAKLWYELGRAYALSGRYLEARQSWEKTLKLDPTHAETLEGMKVLGRYRIR